METPEQNIEAAAKEITEILNRRGLGMQAVIQISKIPQNPIIAAGNTEQANIILPGDEEDLHPGIVEAMKPVGDPIGPAPKRGKK